MYRYTHTFVFWHTIRYVIISHRNYKHINMFSQIVRFKKHTANIQDIFKSNFKSIEGIICLYVLFILSSEYLLWVYGFRGNYL